MMAPKREVWITGIGLVSNLGEGAEPHLEALKGARPPVVDADSFPSYLVHPAVALSWDEQIPKKADQRQMEPWQKLGVYAAGRTLAQAGLKGEKDILSRTDLVVAAGGGERDYAVDGQILTGLPQANDRGAFLNDRLMNDIRPTLFLAQLSNLLGGNIDRKSNV
jgi:3-oxoacyl-[acyl-carrier-protein] synthase II